MSLKHAILTLLEAGPASGYDLVKKFKESLGYFWNASHQQVYLELKKLTEQNWVIFEAEAQSDKPDRKVYRLTDSGRQELLNWLSKPTKPNKINDALLVKIFNGHLLHTAELQREMASHIAIHQHTLKKLLGIEQVYLTLSKAQQQRYLMPYMTLRRGILGEQAWLAWAEEMHTVLRTKKEREIADH